MNYKQGAETKEKILKEAKILFYQQGYKDTTFKQIAKKAKVNIGLVSYHFGTKDSLGASVYGDILRNRHEVFYDKIGILKINNDYDILEFTTAEYWANTESYIKYPKYQRFITEVVAGEEERWRDPLLNDSLNLLCDKFNISLSDNEFIMHKCLFLPYASVITPLINSGIADIPVKEICEYHTKTRMFSLGIPKKEIDKVITKVEEIVSAVKIDVDEQFNFS